MDEQQTPQILTNDYVNFRDVQLQLVEVLQDEVDQRIQVDEGSIKLVSGNYEGDNFVGKSLCHPRYKTKAKFCCMNKKCQSGWTSYNTTVEMIVQDQST